MDNRYFAELDEIIGNKITISGQEHQHLTRVRRAQLGDKIIVFNGNGIDYLVKIVEITKSNAVCEILEKKQNISAVNRPNIHVFVACVKSDALNQVLDSLTQLNIDKISVYESDWTIAKIKNLNQSKFKMHFIQSCKQCERADLPEITFYKFDEMLDILKTKDLCLFAYEDATKNILDINLPRYKNKEIAIVVGGEGGFSPNEVEDLSKISEIVSLGPTILRTPVATCSLTSVVLAELGSFKR